jgi:hypothetical protein
MTPYTENKRGSEWNKWDLHVHTPASIYQRYGNNDEVTWEAYIKDLESLDENFAVLGINDYLFIEGYQRLKKEKEQNGRLKNIKCLLPVVEFRIEKFAGVDFGKLKRINLHVIFSDEVPVETIISQFLNALEQSYFLDSGEKWTRAITPASVEELGNKIKSGVPATELHKYGSALIEGFNNLNVKEDMIFEALNKDCFEGKFLIAVGKTEWAELKWTDASIATKKSIINMAHLVFTAANSIEEYQKSKAQLTNQNVNDLLLDCSDAHYLSNSTDKDRIGNCYTWIKALPSFEGLKQIVYETTGRVRVQALRPDIKNDRHVISSLQFEDKGKKFGTQTILLNDNLNAVIGGKSSGKSLLIYSTAKSIDPEQVDRTSKRLNFDGYGFDTNFNFKVQWKNGDIDVYQDKILQNKLHKITYIPQLYINYLVEKNNKEELNNLINNILVQDTSFNEFYENIKKSITSTTSDIERLLNEYLSIRVKAFDAQKKSKEIGGSTALRNGIEKINGDISQAQKTTNLSKEEFSKYNSLLATKTELEKSIRTLNTKEETLKAILKEFVDYKNEMFGFTDWLGEQQRGKIDRLIDNLLEPSDDVNQIRFIADRDFNALISNLEKEIASLTISIKRGEIETLHSKNAKDLEPYLAKLAGQKELQKLQAQLQNEKLKLQQAETLEKQYGGLMDEYGKIRAQIASLLKKRFDLYKSVESRVNDTKNEIGAEIQLKCSLLYKLEDFNLFEQTNKAAISSEHIFNSFFSNGLVNYELVPNFFGNFLRVNEDKLFYDTEKFIPLKIKTTIDAVLRGLVKDSFVFDYEVTYKGDDLLKMSPGKKGTVLLILFLQISSSEYPILIDQPEDNLDNRTIYELLCKMIIEKKKDRQIIIVSHNANLVVSTDAENIIVANQEGQGTEIKEGRFQFEYVNGALEYTFVDDKNDHILLRQGIREHVCDILEGGNEAFKKREKKYAIKG